MKMLFVSNENLAASMKESLAAYFENPEIEVLCFKYPSHLKATTSLKAYLQACLALNPEENFLILADRLGSTAFNETALLLQRLGLTGQALIVTGMSLALAVRLYHLKNESSLEAVRQMFPTRSFIFEQMEKKSA